MRYLQESNEENIEEIFNINFTVTVENFGSKETIALVENGENIPVNKTNRHVYIEKYLNWFFNDSIQDVFKPFLLGIYRVCDEEIISVID